jgi:hypothetical protein
VSTPLTGLSAIQASNAGGNSSTLNSSSVPISLPPSDQNNNPEQRYRLYGNNSGLQMLTFPPDYPEFRMVLIAKNYTAGATGVTFMPNTQGTAVNGYVLPVPQMRLGDRYNLQYDDNFAFLNMLRGNRAFNAIDTVGKITGFNINKFKTVLFEAPALKRHEFIWKFSPKNMAEATTINNIVK